MFKDYIKEKIGDGYTIPLLGMWTSIDNLKKDWKLLPETFVLKSTLQSDGRFIKIIKKKSEIDLHKLAIETKEWLKVKNTLINSYCSAYYDAIPRIIAEQYVESVSDQLYDYKLFCFDGKPHYAYVAVEHFEGGINKVDYPISFFDMDWNRLDVHYGNHPNFNMNKPKHFDEMVQIAGKLSKEFPFVRVDFFDTPEKLYIAELTFYPGGGNTEYHPLNFDKEMGLLFHLPEKSKKNP